MLQHWPWCNHFPFSAPQRKPFSFLFPALAYEMSERSVTVCALWAHNEILSTHSTELNTDLWTPKLLSNTKFRRQICQRRKEALQDRVYFGEELMFPPFTVEGTEYFIEYIFSKGLWGAYPATTWKDEVKKSCEFCPMATLRWKLLDIDQSFVFLSFNFLLCKLRVG